MQIVYKKLHELTPYDKNPRINDKAVEVVANSILEYGFKNPIVVDENNVIINGHTRYLASTVLELEEVPVIVADDLTPAQVKAFRIMDNKSSEFAEWDYELLFKEIEDIKLDLGTNIEDLTGFSDLELDELNKAFDNLDTDIDFGTGTGTGAGNNEYIPGEVDIDDYPGEVGGKAYTSKINIPQYEIRGEKPELAELVKVDKTNELIAKINKVDIPEDIKDFLIKASYRHLAFNYQKVAEYYAHASKEVQELMEDSALVIIDYNDALKNGYVQIKSAIDTLIEEGERDV